MIHATSQLKLNKHKTKQNMALESQCEEFVLFDIHFEQNLN